MKIKENFWKDVSEIFKVLEKILNKSKKNLYTIIF